MKSLCKFLSLVALMLSLPAFAQSTLGSTVDVGNQSYSGASNQGVNVVTNSFGSPLSTAFLNNRIHTNQAMQTGTAIATMAVLGTCQTAGRAFGLQGVGAGLTWSGKGDLEPICGGINSGALIGAVYKAKEEAAKPNATVTTRAYAAAMMANACAIESVADVFETANSVDRNVEVCPEVVTRASRKERREREAAQTMGTQRVSAAPIALLP